jgi:hypothetical protein
LTDASGDGREIEALAQALYEAGDHSGLRWAKRDQAVRESWLKHARLQMRAAKPAPAP